ncbi:hypothetical protein B4125_3501 [Bacillus paralicheniformis]|nr:hypothetical protein SC10_B2orf00011 [Bacillus paralicheniformis]OLG05429.1 hypothetical protein B4125_3501 [Bacillus paralicheniformis]TWJ47529.1 hypothetical protein CHCC5027_3954 [Bacillus paralicheniformis]TWK47861.1 hypothetical protein CHCC20348_3384 [Bacillus paralicheniformis]TWM05980.1 hypothetical protein CHCC15136_4432 [Bacillus paralicheniformis]
MAACFSIQFFKYDLFIRKMICYNFFWSLIKATTKTFSKKSIDRLSHKCYI